MLPLRPRHYTGALGTRGLLAWALPQSRDNGIAAQVDRRMLALMVEQMRSGVIPSAAVILMTLLVAPSLVHWKLAIAVAGLQCLTLGHNFLRSSQLAAELTKAAPDPRTLRGLVAGTGCWAFLWGASTWPLEIQANLDFMSFLVVIIALFSICLSTLSAAFNRETLIAVGLGGALSLAVKIAWLTPTIGMLLPLGYAILMGTFFSYAAMVRRQAHGGVLLQMRNSRNSNRLARANQALKLALDRANWLADRDALTELRNRRAFENEIAPFVERFAHRRFALLLLDIDHFKQINDHFGHETGDGVLVAVGTALRQWENGGSGRISGRWGGEEFIALVAIRKGETAREFAEDLRLRIEMLGEQLHWPGTVRLTTSIGCAPLSRSDDFDQALSRADRALYEAKHAGRNRWRLAA